MKCHFLQVTLVFVIAILTSGCEKNQDIEFIHETAKSIGLTNRTAVAVFQVTQVKYPIEAGDEEVVSRMDVLTNSTGRLVLVGQEADDLKQALLGLNEAKADIKTKPAYGYGVIIYRGTETITMRVPKDDHWFKVVINANVGGERSCIVRQRDGSLNSALKNLHQQYWSK